MQRQLTSPKLIFILAHQRRNREFLHIVEELAEYVRDMVRETVRVLGMSQSDKEGASLEVRM